MSSRTVKHNKGRVAEKTPFCSICKAKNLPRQAYESHNVRDDSGRLCCPTLRNHACSKCYKHGHFEDHCTSRPIEFDRTIRSAQMQRESEKKVTAKVAIRMTAIAAAFGSDDSDDSDEEEIIAEKLAKVKPPVEKKAVVPMSKRSWADWDTDDEEEEEIDPKVTLRKHQTGW